MATNEPRPAVHLDTNTGYVQMNPNGNPRWTGCPSNHHGVYANTGAAGEVSQVNGIQGNHTGQFRALNTQRHTYANDKPPIPRQTINGFAGLNSRQDPSWFPSGHLTPPPPPPCQPPPPYSVKDDTEPLVHVTVPGTSSPSESPRSSSSDNSDSLFIPTDSSTFLHQTISPKDGRELVVKLNCGNVRGIVVVLGVVMVVVVAAVLLVINLLIRAESNKVTNTEITENPVSVTIFAAHQSSTTASFLSQQLIDDVINPPKSSSLSTTTIQKPVPRLLLFTTAMLTTTATIDKAADEADKYSTVCMIQKTCPNRPGDVHITCPYSGDIGGIQAMDPGERNDVLQSCLISHGFVGRVEARSVCRLCNVSDVNNCLEEITGQFRPTALMKNCPPQE